MKKVTRFMIVLFALFLFLPTLKAGDVLLYNSGNIATSSSAYTIPSFFGGAGWSYNSRVMDVAKKDTTFFPEVLNVIDSTAYGIELLRTDDSTGVNFLTLRLPSCDSIYVEAWGTGGRGIVVTNDVTADTLWKGSSSYNLFSVTQELDIADSVTIKIAATGRDGVNTYSNGGTWINRIVVYRPYGFTLTQAGAEVSTSEGLADALSYTEYPSANITIELKDNTDASGIYMIGTGMPFPQLRGDLTIKAAPGAHPQIWGSFASNNGMKVKNLTFEGLSWNGGDSTLPGFNNEAYQPFAVVRADSVLGDYTVRNCNFTNLDFQRIFRSNSCAGAVVKRLVFENNYFDNLGWNKAAGSHGNTFIQIVNAANYEMDHLVFRENMVQNFHGNQFFNIPRQGTTAEVTDVNFSVTIENNTFYKLGGQGGSHRNFLEYNQNLGGMNGVININNNIFYERWSYDKFPQSQLTLFEPADGQNLTVNVLNNFFYPDDVVTNNPTYTPEDTTYFLNLDIYPKNMDLSKITHNRKDLFMDDFPGMIINPEEYLSKKSCPLFTAGTEGTYVGSYSSYYTPAFIEQPTGAVVKNLSELIEALAYTEYDSDDITFEFMNCTDEGGVYLLGNSGLVFPQTGGNITFKNAAGQKPVLAGRLTSKNGVKATTLLYEGLEFNAESVKTKYDVDTYSPFYLTAKDSIMTAMVVRNCSFKNLPLKQLILSTNKIAAGAVVKDFVMEHSLVENCGVDNDSTKNQSGHFFQLSDKDIYEFDKFTFRNNIINSWRNSQAFNIGRAGTTDTIAPEFKVVIENNTFYKFGGNGTNARQFIGYGKNLGGHNASIDINNNLFYERGSKVGFPHSKLTLPEKLASGQVVSVNLLNNLFYPDNVVANNPVITPEESIYFDNLTPEGDSTIVANINRNDLFMSDFPGMELDMENKLFYKLPIYTAGTNGTYLGSINSYYVPAFIEQPTGAIVKNLSELIEALAYTEYESGDITIELMNCTDEGGVYLLGNSGLVFPQTGGNLTITKAEGQKPVLAGRLTSRNGVKAATLLYEGLEFNAESVYTQYNAATYSPFYMGSVDSIMTAFVVRNCSFKNLPLAQLIMGANNLAPKSVVKDFLMEFCLIQDVGANQDTVRQHSGHMFQISNKNTLEFDHFTFRNNIVNNWRNSQVFNIPRTGTTADSADVNFVVNIENNTFYKFGGNATNVRNFLEYNQNLGGLNAVININNNLFYERGGSVGFPHAKLTLLQPAAGQLVTLNLLNNFFYPDNVVMDQSTPDEFPNLRLVGPAETDIAFSRNDLFMSNFPGMELDLENKLSYKLPLYTAGTEGSFIGSIESYYVPAFIEQPTGAIVKNLQELTEALAYTEYESDDLTIELMNCTDEGGVYLLGNSGLVFPQTGGDLTITNAEGQTPVLAGRLTSKNGAKAATLLYEGLEFNAESVFTQYTSDTYSPLYFAAQDSIMTALVIRNCTFRNLPLAQLILSTNRMANDAVVKDFIMEYSLIQNCGVDNDSTRGQQGHLFLVHNRNSYEFDKFTFRDNVIDTWRNSQVFNIARAGTTNSIDPEFKVAIENNLFYKFGGNGNNARNFLEYDKALGGVNAEININNNIFYERGSTAGFPHSQLKLPTGLAPEQVVTVNLLNNFFYPNDVVASNPEITPGETIYFDNLTPMGDGDVVAGINRNDLFMESLEISKVFRNEAKLTISKQSALFTAGTGESWIGPEQLYVGNAGAPVVAYITKQKAMHETAATVETDPVYLMMADDENFVVDLIALTDVSANASLDLDQYDIALVQESLGGGDKILTPAGPLGLAKFDLPVLYNKTYAFRAGRALVSGQTGTGAEQQGLTITVDPAQQGNDLFKGLTFAQDNTLALFKAPTTDDGTLGGDKSVKALNYAKEVVMSDDNTLIATPTGVTEAVIFINDLPAGTVVGGETLAERMITVGFNFGATCADKGTNMTEAGFTIWRNALYMLAGLPVPADPYTALPQADKLQKNAIFSMGGNLYVQAAEQTTINIYNLMGALVRTVRVEQGLNTIEGLNQGQIYLVKISSEVTKVVL